MNKFLLGVISGVALLTGVLFFQKEDGLGATPSRGDLIGIYNATTTDLIINDGFGSAIAVDVHGRAIAVTQ